MTVIRVAATKLANRIACLCYVRVERCPFSVSLTSRAACPVRIALLVLRHELLFLILPDFDAMQQGHRDSALATPTIS